MMSRIDARPCSRTYAARPSITLSGAVGSAKVAVPTWTADAPAIRNSSASAALVTPPAPVIGTGKPTAARAEHGTSLHDIDAHAEDSVDRGERVRAGLFARARDCDHVRR